MNDDTFQQFEIIARTTIDVASAVSCSAQDRLDGLLEIRGHVQQQIDRISHELDAAGEPEGA